MPSRNRDIASKGSETPSPEQDTGHRLNEIQRRACRLHHQHGATCGGYTLEEWLEAEHELDEENKPPENKDHVNSLRLPNPLALSPLVRHRGRLLGKSQSRRAGRRTSFAKSDFKVRT